MKPRLKKWLTEKRMVHIKGVFSLIIVLVALLFALGACGEKDEFVPPGQNDQPQETPGGLETPANDESPLDTGSPTRTP